jgi:hypothetical protein
VVIKIGERAKKKRWQIQRSFLIVAGLSLALALLTMACRAPDYDGPFNWDGDNSPVAQDEGLEIISAPVTQGRVNESYSYVIQKDQEAECKILAGPGWLVADGNTLTGTPWHISNAEVGRDHVKVECSDGVHSAYQEFDLEIGPGDFSRHPGLQYDHIQFIRPYS